MWRNYVICILLGLLIATSVTSLNLLRQTQAQQADVVALRQRATAAEATRTALQTTGPTSGDLAPTPPAVSVAPAVPRPAPTASSSDSSALQQIESDVARLRGLTPKNTVS